MCPTNFIIPTMSRYGHSLLSASEISPYLLTRLHKQKAVVAPMRRKGGVYEMTSLPQRLPFGYILTKNKLVPVKPKFADGPSNCPLCGMGIAKGDRLWHLKKKGVKSRTAHYACAKNLTRNLLGH